VINTMNAPVITKPLLPSASPHVSSIEWTGHELLVPVSGTLPPVCVMTGKPVPLSNDSYLLEYLGAQPGSTDRPVADQGSTCAVRLPLSPQGRTIYRLASQARWWFTALLVLGFFVVHIMLDGWAYLASALIVGFAPIVFAAEILTALGLSFQATRCSDGRVAIRGIKASIIQDMLTWQTTQS